MPSRFDGKLITALQVKKGNVQTINAQSVTVLEQDADGNVILGKVAAVPSDGGAGYAIGAQVWNSLTGHIYANEGTAGSATWNDIGAITAADIATGAVTTDEILNGTVASADLAEGAVQWTSVDVTAAEIKALAATPKTLVTAPGATKALEFISATLFLNYGSEALAENAGGSNLAIKYENAAGVKVSEDIEMTGFITLTADSLTRTVAKKDAIVAASGSVNKALVLHNIGAGEITGNATNDTVLTVKIAYRVLTGL